MREKQGKRWSNKIKMKKKTVAIGVRSNLLINGNENISNGGRKAVGLH